MSHVIGVDIGTSGIKAGAMDVCGKLSYIAYASYSLNYPAPGRVEVDFEEIWTKVIELIGDTAKRITQSGSVVTAISFSTFCNASVLMNRNGDSLGPGILYMDYRSKEEVERIKQTMDMKQLFRITGNRIEPGMISVSNLIWLQRFKHEWYENAYKWGHLSTFILAKMTGEFVLDWTQASYTGLFDVQNYKWSDELCKAFGVRESLLPRIVNPTETLGLLARELSEDLGISQVPVVAGAADTACSTFALGLKPGTVFESVGTSDVLTVVTDEPSTFDPRYLNRCHVLPNQWLSHGAMSTPGLAIRWFYDQFLRGEGSLQEAFTTLPHQSSTGANGVFFLPYMHGERSPIWDSDARGLFVGLSLNTTKADMARAILEGCAFGLRQLMDIIHDELGIYPSLVPCVGGGSKNPFWCQIKANVLNVEIETKEIQETALLGACYLAAHAVSAFSIDDLFAFSEVKNTQTHIYRPQDNQVEQYTRLYKLFETLYPTLKLFYQQASSTQVMQQSVPSAHESMDAVIHDIH